MAEYESALKDAEYRAEKLRAIGIQASDDTVKKAADAYLNTSGTAHIKDQAMGRVFMKHSGKSWLVFPWPERASHG